MKHFKEAAPDQESILQALSAAGWPACLEHVLPAHGANGKQKLRDTIRNLNRSLRPFLRLHQEGNGTRLRWEPLRSRA